MSEVAAAPGPLAPGEQRQSLWHRVRRIVAWLVGIALLVGALRLAGVDVGSWLESVWDTVNDISIGYVILGCLFEAAQTTLTAFGW